MDVSGFVVIEPDQPAADGAVVTVRLLDVSRLDAASETLGETVVGPIAHPAGERTMVPFSMTVTTPTGASSDLTLEARVAVTPGPRASASGVEPSDLVTTTSNPVAKDGASGIVLRVRPARRSP
ncbi:YbaY family lipoprotein [Nakamurella sp.]|uniref:YbaY family lipoprotein n=1 Tax=Nakamurella sp. TaxID=1869182 RepID=UPI003783F6C0